MREADRRREIARYYLGVSPDEISSHVAASFDLWESLARYRRELAIGARWLEIGGGIGDLAADALEHGYDVVMTDVQDALLEAAARRHPQLSGRLQRVDVFEARAVAALGARGPFSIVAALGAVLNHARDGRELARGFRHLVALGEVPSLLIVDLLVREMFPGYPGSIWADFLHVLPGLDELSRLIRASGLQLLESYSLFHRYPPTPAYDREFEERMLRVVLLKADPPCPIGGALR
jgi:Methyltransferase domain